MPQETTDGVSILMHNGLLQSMRSNLLLAVMRKPIKSILSLDNSICVILGLMVTIMGITMFTISFMVNILTLMTQIVPFTNRQIAAPLALTATPSMANSMVAAAASIPSSLVFGVVRQDR